MHLRTLFDIGLALFASLSPLLTFAWLWQLKEWRWDRLREHLQREGCVLLVGTIRPLLVALYGVSLFIIGGTLAVTTALLLLTLLGVVQWTQKRQRLPVFTQKAITTTATAVLVTLAFSIALASINPLLLPVIVLLQPLTLAVAWGAWFPLDLFLKRRIMGQARRLRQARADLVVIGVTGSVGKTTTKELLALALKDLNPAVTPAYVNSEIGVARWMIRTLSASKPTVMIVELGAYRTGEIALMCSYVQPTIGTVTAVGNQHVALFGSPEALTRAKGELIRSLPPTGQAFLNGDNDGCREIAKTAPCPVTIVSTGGHADIEAMEIEETSTGIRFRTLGILFDIPLHGTHNVTNALLAIAIGKHVGVEPKRTAELLRTFKPLSGTFEVTERHGVHLLDDTHNSSAASVKAAIAWARTQPQARKTLLMAGLIELGEAQAPAERELGATATSVFERIVVIDPQSARNVASSGATVEALTATTSRLERGELLVCVGRMAPSIIDRFLPL